MRDNWTLEKIPEYDSPLPLPEPRTRPLRFSITHLLAVIAALAVPLAIWRLEEPEYFLFAMLAVVLEVAIGLFWYYRSAGASVLWLFGCWASLALIPYHPGHPSEYPYRMRVQMQMQQLSRALDEYYHVHGHYPPAYTVAADGRPLLSWRVLILPYLEREALYKQFHLDEPWDSPHNLPLANEIPSYLFQNSATQKGASEVTTYVAIVGPSTMWPQEKSCRMADIRDGKRNTLALVEWPESDIIWTEPRDLPADNLTPLTQVAWPDLRARRRYHGREGRVATCMADGSIYFWAFDKLSPATITALLTRDGGEPIAAEDLQPKYE